MTAEAIAGEFAPALITNMETFEVIRCMFRPKEYTFTKSNRWTMGRSTGRNVPQLEFSGGDAATLTMELFFDTYEQHMDVRLQYTNRLWNFMKISPRRTNPRTGRGEPPRVEFRWGAAWSFKAVITQMTQRFTMFMPSGMPVRAVVNVTFSQAEEPGEFPFQNPTSYGLAGHTIRVVRDGDTIDWIAYEEYGNPTFWRRIADANNLENPQRLRPGQTLVVPPL